MNNDLRTSKQAIRNFIRAHWSDEKLCAVYAFNRDGKMTPFDGCCCLRGVTLSAILHTGNHSGRNHDAHYARQHHYNETRLLPGALDAELAYTYLSRHLFPLYPELILDLAQRRLSAILRAEMRRRERLRISLASIEQRPALDVALVST